MRRIPSHHLALEQRDDKVVFEVWQHAAHQVNGALLRRWTARCCVLLMYRDIKERISSTGEIPLASRLIVRVVKR